LKQVVIAAVHQHDVSRGVSECFGGRQTPKPSANNDNTSDTIFHGTGWLAVIGSISAKA
jgi:hypothetical protein